MNKGSLASGIRGGRLAATCLELATGAPAIAQSQTATPTVAAEDNGGLADIIVTAQRRAQSAQHVPIPIAAFSRSELSKSSVTSTADLPTLVPGLTMFPTAARSPMTLRGVGNNGLATAPSVKIQDFLHVTLAIEREWLEWAVSMKLKHIRQSYARA